MPETKAAEHPGRNPDKRDMRDMRLLVLLLIGLLICLPHLYDAVRPARPPRQAGENHAHLVWLETTDPQGNGLYWLKERDLSWPQLFAALGRPLPPGPMPPLSDEIPSAYRLPTAAPPQAIPLPAQLAPIFFQPIPINQASAEVLISIPGIGPRLAEAIIAYRTKHGSLKDRAALLTVDGIGAKKAAIIADHVRFE